MSAKLAALGVHPAITAPLLRQCARASDDAYRARTHAAGQSEGLLVVYGDGPIFAVRGTTLDGWCILTGDGLIDVAFIPWRDPVLGWLHHGFLAGSLFAPGGARALFKAAWADLLAVDEPLVVTGHSKGGAEALIVGALLNFWRRPVKAVVTVDAPKLAIGGGLAEALAGVPVLHIVAGRSPVSHVPVMPWWNRGPRGAQGPAIDVDPLPAGEWPMPEAHRIKHIRARLDAWLAAAA